MASFDLTANINARVNTTTVRAAADQLRKQLIVNSKINVDISSNAIKGSRALGGSISLLNKELVKLIQNSQGANSVLSNLGSAFQNVNAQITRTSQAQKTLSETAKSAKNAGTQLEQFGRQAGLAFRRFAGFRLASGVVTQFFSATTSAAKEAVSFQRELIRVAQVSGRSLQSLGSLQNTITGLSTSLGVASSDLIDISRILTQAGLSTNETSQSLEALAKSSLAPTFTNIQNTAEGAIAIFRQFGISTGQLEQALGGINAVSGQFAVESDDIIAAVKRAGGVFASTSKGVSEGVDALNEFVAVFTSVRATTREGAETIATGLRTIFTRIQRPRTIAFLQELGVNLLDLKGKFVGPFEAINRISSALGGLDRRDPQFAKLVEELGGFRQVGKVIPLLTAQETRLNALRVAQEGYNSLTRDSETAQEALAVQLIKVREEFVALIRDITGTDTFKLLISQVINLTRSLIQLANSLKPVLPLIGAIGVIRGASGLAQFGRGLFSRGAVRFNDGGFVPKQNLARGGRVKGIVPGGRGTKDDFDTTLNPGDFVIRRSSVDTLGRSNLPNILDNLEKQKFGSGGSVPVSLTRGEFVVDDKMARILGPEILNTLNNADKLGKNEGGRIGLINGGFPFRSGATTVELNRLLQALTSENATVGKIVQDSLGVQREQITSFRQQSETRERNLTNRGALPRATEPTRSLSPRSRDLQFDESFQRPIRSRGIPSSRLRRPVNERFSLPQLSVPRSTTALAVGGTLLGGQIGGTTGAGLSAAAITFELASASSKLGAKGKLAAVALGALAGVLGKISQETKAEQLKKSSDAINSVLENTRESLEKFEKTEDVSDLSSVSKGFAETATSISDIEKRTDNVFAAFTKGLGSSASRFGSLGSAFIGARTASGLVAGRAGVAAATVSAPVTAAAIATTAGAIITKDLIQKGLTPENFVTKEQVRSNVSQTEGENLQIGKNIQKTLSESSKAAQVRLDQQFLQGQSSSDILSQLTDDDKQALAFGFAGSLGLESLGSVSGDERTARANAQLQSILPIREEEVKQIQRLQEKVSSANQRLQEAGVQLDNFNEKLIQTAADIARAGDAGQSFVNLNQALLGSGIVSTTRGNVFNNPRAFSTAELSGAARSTVSLLGGNDRFSDDLVRTITGLRDLQNRLPQVLANVAQRTDKETQSVAVAEAIRDNFSVLPEQIRESLASKIETSTITSRQGLSLRQFSEQESSRLIESEIENVVQVFKKATDVSNKAINEYEQAVSKWIELQLTANSSFDQVASRSVENRNQITALDRDLTFQELVQGINEQVARFGDRGRVGFGGNVNTGSLDFILQQLNDLDLDRSISRDQAISTQAGPAQFEDSRRITDGSADLSLRENDLVSALKLIANNTQISAAAQQKLVEIENAKKTSQQLAEDFVSANPLEKLDFNRQIRLARATREGAQLTGERAGLGLRGERILTGLEGGTTRESDRRIREQLSRRSDVEQLFNIGGRTAREALVSSPEEQNLRTILEQNLRTQQQAGQAIAQRDQNVADQFIDNANSRFDAIIDSFSTVLKNFADNLPSVPEAIEIGGTVSVNINVTGGEVLENIRGEFGSLVDNKIKVALNKNIDPTNKIENFRNA